jgi:nucleoside-diphosphate-sugar epimerase
VVYTAGASSRNDAAYKAIYVEGPQNLLEVLRAQAQRPRRIVFASSTAVYGQTSGEWVVETSPTEPKDFSGRRLLEGEEVVRTGPFPAIVVRFGGIYGPGRSHLIARVRDGRAVCEPGPPTYLNLIHRDDCVGVLRHLLTMAGPEPMYIAVDHEPADLGTILRWTAQRLGVRLHAGAGAAMLRPRSSNKRCSNARLLHSGYRFRYPMFREGFDAVLAQNP